MLTDSKVVYTIKIATIYTDARRVTYMRNKLLLAAGLLFCGAVIGVAQLTAQAASVDTTRDYDKYAVVYGGTMSIGEVRDKYNNKDHDAVFQAFGISESDLDGDIRKGVVYQDGRVVVDGKTVATGATMAARHLGGSSISGSSTAKKISVSQMGSAQAALVKFDSNGKFEWAIMTPCGNPVNATPKPVKKPAPTPVYSCDSLSATRIGSSRDEFGFKTEYTAASGATVHNFIYDFGDGTTRSVKSATITHQYAEPGTYTAKVTFQVKVGNSVKNASGDCTTQVTVDEEPCPIPGKEHLSKDSPDCKEDKPSIEIEKTVNSAEHAIVDAGESFTYEVVVRNTGDVAIEDAVVSDPAPSGVTFISASAGSVSGNKWTHTIDELAVGGSRSFTLTAKVTVAEAGTIKNTVCVDTPTVPGGPDDCDDATVEVPIEVCDTETNSIINIKPSEYDESRHTKNLSECDDVSVCDPDSGEIITVPRSDIDDYESENSEACQDEVAPPKLPTTGTADIISGIAGIGALTMTSYSYVASRRSM